MIDLGVAENGRWRGRRKKKVIGLDGLRVICAATIGMHFDSYMTNRSNVDMRLGPIKLHSKATAESQR